MKNISTALAVILFTTVAAKAQLSLTGGSYSQNFNGIGTTATAAVPTGWKTFMNIATPNYASGLNNTTQTVTGTAGSTASYGIYNFGSSSSDRGLGFISSGNANWGGKPGQIEFALTNNNAATLSSINLSWDYELFRTGSRDFEWNFYYSTNGTSWTAFTAGDQAYASGVSTATIAKSFALTGVTVPQGSSLYFRWEYTVSSGTTWTNSPGLGLDNFQLTAVPEPHEYALGIVLLLGAIVFGRLRSHQQNAAAI